MPLTVSKRPHHGRKNRCNITLVVSDIPSFYQQEATRQGTRIDASIAHFIAFLNEKGIVTDVSCSGLKQDHPGGVHPRSAYLRYYHRKKSVHDQLEALFRLCGWANVVRKTNDCSVVYLYEGAYASQGCPPSIDGYNLRYSENRMLLRWLHTFHIFQEAL